jgi:hypothetical protein
LGDVNAAVQPRPACVTVNVLPATVSVPMRWTPLGFAETLKLVVPPPLPLAPDVIVSQPLLLLVAVQVHPARAVTDVDPVPPVAAIVGLLGGEIVNVQAAAACVTVNVRFATVNVPVRWVPIGLELALKLVVPSPDPLAPDVMVSHPALLVAVQVQPVGMSTDVDPVPPVAETFWLVGVRVAEQAAAACVTVNVFPAIVSVPVRCVPFGFALALKLVVPLPDPLAPDVMVSQAALLVAVHPHPAPAETATLPVPPVAPTDWLVGEIPGLQVTAHENVFDKVLVVVPPGPIAATRAS